MTTRLGAGGEFCWMDLKTRDVAGTAAFLTAALDWRFAVAEADWRRATAVFLAQHRIGGVSDLADPVYPPDTPAHIAYYLAVDDVDRRAEAAEAAGARLVVPPFDAGDQGRMATLVDPVGAAVSLWQAREFTGWRLPPGLVGGPARMVLACPDPHRARHFYRHVLGAVLDAADIVASPGPAGSAPRWELAVTVADPHEVAARVREHGPDRLVWTDQDGRRVARLVSPEGLTFPLRAAG
ncbi:VOC family protein [Goodfellowiella coeruleoviolacea]|uniref:VOC domain-containing protein n=1 Tax=Goodfellowiella coeruleoviolacea TaxID=334858 RepID=A0AAE3GCS6_9PSEU|nr:VOC family protein [Goodfellowiella coeruleoviolacea]MCP2164789.1 hypothetical protein [Goodfellowiella coeruleoviolacea]